MNRFMIWASALMLAVAFVAVAPEANAGLFNRKSKCCKPQKCKKSRRAKSCCPQTSCAPAPTCCAPAPTCCEAPAPCGCAAAPAPSCGCKVASTCGCETNCNCLSRRELRKANRNGQCCGAKAKSCNTCSTCSAPVSTCGCSAPVTTCGCESAVSSCGCESAAPAGCSSCGDGVIIESAPSPVGEEAAPEAPATT